ncbi:response regulator [Brumicola nitratireducens]|uniref:Two-component response regulator n=1 Tax=Glaciecola nitratireducens (strain JCM 12485 / KCTC 12276 / FR1064) TaxID=1085623 RepID=G4QEX4_GLANF|nr:response regulator transcription factor [Glaciecola nitratireducens]AEP28237.1 two-component response regulator [Glaciecola nitratireducens FR1064]
MKVLLVDDHAIFCEGLSYVLAKLDDDVVFLEANNFDDAALHLKNNADIDLLLLDLKMPLKDGFSLLDFCRQHYPLISIVVLSASKNIHDVERAIKAGAVGFIPKDTPSKVMVNALQLVMMGEIYIPRSISQQIDSDDTETNDALTPRQREVTSMMMKGYSNKKIALEMGITVATIKMHVTSVFKKLGVNNRTEAAIAMQRLARYAAQE